MFAVSGSLTQVAQDLRTGRRDLQGYINEACDRIEFCEPHLSALLPESGRRERLLREAAELQGRYPGEDRPPLYGVPLGVKDIYRVDGFGTRCGSALPAALFAGAEASVVTRLRDAGALILGKTVTTEFAYFEPGPTRNPRHPEHTPGGSSSGSAAAVGAGYCPLALGSQTVGSVIRPAAFCGVAGFKTSYGRVPLDGVIPYAPSLDHFGFFVPEAPDLSLVLAVLLGDAPVESPTRGTLGIPAGPYLGQATPEALAAFERQVEALMVHGWEIRPVPALEDIPEINERHQRLAAVEMAQIHQEWFEQYESLYRPRTAAWIREGLTIEDTEEGIAVLGRTELRRRLHGLMDEHGLDAWISPAAPGPAPHGIEATGSPLMNLPWTYAGLPVATVPAGLAENGLPLGLQVVGRFWDDSRLAALAGQLRPASAEGQ
jgi:Asp-tRNA(Asn)/Glu-tRNA(Gln) amidotransferase A subunit family amidase